jgi:HlyD family secretion protein
MQPRVIGLAIMALPLLLLLALLPGCSDSDSGTALGTLERDRVAHTATVNEVITQLPVAQGTFVRKGTILVRMDERHQRAMVQRARAERTRAQAQLDKLRAGPRDEEIAAARARVAGARAELVEAEKIHTREKELAERGATSQSQLDLALARRDAARADLKSAEEQLRELENGSREEDLRMARAELEAAEAALASEEKLLSDLTIVAEQDGVLDTLPWNLGERVTAGSPVAILLAGEAPYARVYVPEPWRVRIREGDSLRVRVDGIEQLFDGTVRWISSEPAFTPYYALTREDRSRLMYLAEVQLPAPAADLPSGIPAQVLLP